jgi:hypothetical protein
MVWKFAPTPTENAGVARHAMAGFTLIVLICDLSAW